MGDERNSILIIDDEIANLQVLTGILEQEYTIFAAKDGATAIKIARSNLPDLILLDIMMPGMDGYEVLAALRDVKATARIPVIFVTALDSMEDEKIGLSLNAADYIGKPFHPAVVRLRVRNQIQILNQIREIERISLLDQLTGIANRRSFDERIQAEWKRAVREGDSVPLSLLLIDVDRFKDYNDSYGHQQGDRALQAVAGVLSGISRRAPDFAARWGGEEFIVLLPGTPPEGAAAIAENIRKQIEDMDIPLADGSPSRVTASIGAVTRLPAAGDLWVSAFLSAADKAMYAAKSRGRNRVEQVAED